MKMNLTTRKKVSIGILSKRLIPFICIMIVSTSLVLVFNSLARSSEVVTLTAQSELFSAQGSNNLKEDKYEITQIVLTDLDSVSGGAIPKVNQVVITDNYAFADWILEDSGGSALLIKRSGKWNLLTSGGGLLNSSELQNLYYVPKKTADKLVQLQSHCSEYPSTCKN